MSRVLRVLGVVVLLALLGGCFWPVPGQNPDRTAYNPSETALDPANVGQLTLRWSWRPGSSVGVRGPVVSAAGVHGVTGDCRLVTLDRTSGRLVWDPPVDVFEGFGPTCGSVEIGDPFVADGRVWVGRQFFFIRVSPLETFENTSTLGFSLEGTDGDPPLVEWSGVLLDNLRGDLAHGISGHIVVTPGPPPFPIPQPSFVTTVSIGTLGGESHILNIPAELAGAEVPGRTLGAAALYDAGSGTLASVPGDTSSGNGLRAFALEGAQTGCGPSTATHDCPLWATPLDGTDAWRAVVGDNGATLFAGTDAGTVYSVDAATGAVQWSAAVGSAVTNSLALAGDTLFVPTASGELVALAADGCGAATCARLWSGATGGAIDQQPAVANGVVYTASADGSLHAFAADGCGAAACPALWSDATGEQISDGPIVNTGWLYVTFDADRTGSTQPGGVLGYTVP